MAPLRQLPQAFKALGMSRVVFGCFGLLPLLGWKPLDFTGVLAALHGAAAATEGQPGTADTQGVVRATQ